MNIETQELDSAVILAVAGRMDAENAPQFEQACDIWIKSGYKRLIADLTGLEYVSSMGLRSFLSVAQRLQSSSGLLILCGLKGLPRQVFEMTRLLDLFTVFDSVEQARASF